ncbi:MAG: hypothetical protein H6Q90_1390 [Deltaproteobacteria bacterium]|nr:hypothetical protein [Deltaproteobacteria bacterium]
MVAPDDRCYCHLMSVRGGHTGGRVVLRPGLGFNGVKVFSATMFADRDQLGEKVTSWIAANSHVAVTEIAVTQSSDAAFHCIAITVFYREPKR